jgi:DNA-directed RNA polymerase specialized sigma subunit
MAEPEEEETDAVPVSVQELARRQTLAIAKAIFEAPEPEISRAEIETATGLSESVVKQRLMAGSNAHGLPATRYFAKRNDGWGLTYVGVSLVKGTP